MQCPKTRWRACGACQRQLREANLEDEYALQSWFVGRINKFLRAQGRQLIGWDEILEGGLSPGAMVMSWRVCHAFLCFCVTQIVSLIHSVGVFIICLVWYPFFVAFGATFQLHRSHVLCEDWLVCICEMAISLSSALVQCAHCIAR